MIIEIIINKEIKLNFIFSFKLQCLTEEKYEMYLMRGIQLNSVQCHLIVEDPEIFKM